ncbi:MAG: iron ABC transporter permease [Limnohabitans sp.]|nr:iron ABC transporter permease [Limnohabitans sp.]
MFARRLFLFLVSLCLAIPILSILGAWLQWDASSLQILNAMSQTVLPDYALTSLILCVLVAFGVISMGSISALAVTLFDFPGRKFLEWALLLPLAMPAYVVAYAYTDFFQFSGPLQQWLRFCFNVDGAVLPDIRNVWGAAFVLSVCLYPYVYLLTRTALSERAAHLMEAARLLGANLWRRIFSLALPLARPAIAAGTALALMETLADFGVSNYFGVQTFTAGIYITWLVMDNRIAASHLAGFLLVFVFIVLTLEQRAQSRMRFGNASLTSSNTETQSLGLNFATGLFCFFICAMPIFLGFVLPVAIMIHSFVSSGFSNDVAWDRFFHWAYESLRLGLITAFVAVAIALFLAFAQRLTPHRYTKWAIQISSLGYAVPGVVIVVGLLLPVAWLQHIWPQSQIGFLLTATIAGLIWAYLVRFIAVALQSIQSGYARIPTTLDDSSNMLGVSGWRLISRVHAPLLSRSLSAAVLLVLVDVMKELPATLMLRPFNTDTLAVMAYQLARDERLGEASLPSLALILAGLLPVILLSRNLRHQ